MTKQHTRLLAVSQLVLTEPGFPVEICGATELHAAFREESRTSLLSTSAALQEIREATGLFVVSRTTPRDLYHATVIAKLP